MEQDRLDLITCGCLVLIVIALLCFSFAGCYVWIKTTSPIQLQVPRDGN